VWDAEIYLGISRLCCFKCSWTLTAANKVLEQEHVTIETRGKHDLWFNDWNICNVIPKMNFFQIRKQLSKSDFSKFDIEDRIAMEIFNSFYDWFITNDTETVPKSKEKDFCSMFHEPSSSPISFNDEMLP